MSSVPDSPSHSHPMLPINTSTPIHPQVDLTLLHLPPPDDRDWVIPTHTPSIIAHALRDGDYARDLLVALDRLPLDRQRDHALEAGSGIGYVTAALSRRCASVVTYEAHPLLHAATVINVARYGAAAPNTQHYKGVLVPDAWREQQQRVPFTLRAEWWASSLATSTGVAPFPFADSFADSSGSSAERTYQLPAYGFEERLERHASTLLVLDVEGAEYELLWHGVTHLPQALRHLIVEWHGLGPLTSQRVANALRNLIAQGFHLLADDYGNGISSRVSVLSRDDC